MSERPRIEPSSVVAAVESYVHSELTDAQQYSNRNPLDASGIWSLHALAAEIYALGWKDGEQATDEKARRERQRERDAHTCPTTPGADS
ncbi:MAG TPA: hypothetical protein VFK41_06535 [Nocardioidaceae bacterium]|nr:hypothetical protein [Nocardioidaceae bacterium]